jgi:hypothetical protein
MINSDYIFEKEISIINHQTHFIIAKEEKLFYLSKKNKLKDSEPFPFNNLFNKIEVHGIIGIIEAPSSKYLLVCSKADLVGLFLKNIIYKVKEVIFLAFECSNANEEQDRSYLQLVKDFITKNPLYFSSTYDLTNSVNDNFNKPKLLKTSVLNQLKPHFCWNYKSLLEVDECMINEKLFIPVICGYIGIGLTSYGEKEFNFMIISRKDNRRSGMRFIYRGLNTQGHSANFVESEHIIFMLEEENYHVVSYVQLRGSIPLVWGQPSNFQPVPKIAFQEKNTYSHQLKCFKNHLSELNSNYGKITLVNLIDKKGDQLKIGELFQNIANDSKHELELDFVWFDFHHECKNMKYENLQRLLDEEYIKTAINEYLPTYITISSNYSFSNAKEDGFDLNDEIKIVSQQNGVIRTNCIDCLDRTNVVQTLFSRHVLHNTLNNLKLSQKQNISVFEPFQMNLEKTFKNMWADHGDHISLTYAGTGAQKSDFTRFGLRTTRGAINDLIIGAKRFYINNCVDGYYQDCHDFFLGKLPFDKYKITFSLKNNRVKTFLIIPAILLVSYVFYSSIMYLPFVSKANAFDTLSLYDKTKNIFIHITVFLICTYFTLKSSIGFVRTKFYAKPVIEDFSE